MQHRWLIGLLGLLAQTVNACSYQPTPAACEPVGRGVSYLERQLNSSLGLLRESPTVQPYKYWLTNDNALAAYALTRLNKTPLANTLAQSIEKYGSKKNGLVEVIWGERVNYPPRVPSVESRQPLNSNELCSPDTRPLGDVICQEQQMGGAKMNDWKDYANLAFLGALNEFQQGDRVQAQELYTQTLNKFDGTGFPDKAFKGNYETYKIALALFVGGRTSILKPDARGPLLNILLTQQDDSGGFVTHYQNASTKGQNADTNVETTSFALLALNEIGCK